METKLVREINALQVLDIIREEEPVSRADIVKKSKLAFPTVMRIVDAFIHRGLVVETEKGDVEVGRRPMLLMLNRDAFYIVSVVIHASLDVLLIDLQSNVLAKWSEPVEPSREDCMQQIDRVAELVDLVIANTNVPRSAIAGVGIGRPGTDFKVDDAVVAGTQFAGWNQDIDVRELLERRLGLPVWADNISRTLAYGELYYGWGKAYKDFLFVMVDFGMSGNLVQKGKVLAGENNVAGEYGHMSIDPLSGRSCYCGNRGCVESYISEVGIVKTVRERIQPTWKLARGHRGNLSGLSFQDLVSALNAGDEDVYEVFRDAGRLLGYQLANMVNMVNPGVIILGGSVVLAHRVVVLEAERVVRECAFSNKARGVRILTTRISLEQQYLGSAALVIMNALNGYVSKGAPGARD